MARLILEGSLPSQLPSPLHGVGCWLPQFAGRPAISLAARKPVEACLRLESISRLFMCVDKLFLLCPESRLVVLSPELRLAPD